MRAGEKIGGFLWRFSGAQTLKSQSDAEPLKKISLRDRPVRGGAGGESGAHQPVEIHMRRNIGAAG